VSQNQSIFHSRLYSLNPYPTMLLSGLSPREELERLNYLSHTLLTHYRKSFQKIYLRYQTLNSVYHTKNYSIF
ncbi:MAG: hypothetical protein O4861_13585, partial [Trichodesmium sp. St16_bin4-tuft]|nr:hypothetical protein [Trichodesmium sp. St4_bin8_1]MDE5071276.1 hypothetical protein [Trichodesmium sp. St5_bin8]MDE5099300.1 hypothetical protein [Trichodesmium sp. St16_bin4-tuft]MDE5104539.1 hypothetical protein [Trichodesmium sp. St19_bin2]